jgi:hypothetical protein
MRFVRILVSGALLGAAAAFAYALLRPHLTEPLLGGRG